MNFIMSFLGWILTLFYNLTSNYGVAIILFTLATKLLLFPLELKQKKSMAKTQKLQPLLMAVQQKYANDKEKLSQETMKLYQKYGINPMSGCLPLLIQIPLIFMLYQVVRRPITYMMGVSTDEVWRIADAFNAWRDGLGENSEILLSLPQKFRTAIDAGFIKNNEIELAQLLYTHGDILNHARITEMWQSGLNVINFDFLGMNLAQTPDWTQIFTLFGGTVDASRLLLWVIPVLSGFTSWLSSYILTGKYKEKKPKNLVLSEEEKQGAPKTNETMNSMQAIMPFMSLIFAFMLPAALGLYWIVGNVIQIIQQILVTKFFNTDVDLEQLEGDLENVKSRKKRKKSR